MIAPFDGEVAVLGRAESTTCEVELQFPNLAPVTGRAVQLVPLSQVPNLAIGLKLNCAVDPADLSHKLVVDWAHA